MNCVDWMNLPFQLVFSPSTQFIEMTATLGIREVRIVRFCPTESRVLYTNIISMLMPGSTTGVHYLLQLWRSRCYIVSLKTFGNQLQVRLWVWCQGNWSSPTFGRYISPIAIRRTDYDYHIGLSQPSFESHKGNKTIYVCIMNQSYEIEDRKKNTCLSGWLIIK